MVQLLVGNCHAVFQLNDYGHATVCTCMTLCFGERELSQGKIPNLETLKDGSTLCSNESTGVQNPRRPIIVISLHAGY